ncbi:hypothetical protein PSEUDO8O_150095 [Pseudomonas sp. 8O]|nr:hypothetical protein PSEUDO8O_150095 [Pseudomonas sp. 8O]
MLLMQGLNQMFLLCPNCLYTTVSYFQIALCVSTHTKAQHGDVTIVLVPLASLNME